MPKQKSVGFFLTKPAFPPRDPLARAVNAQWAQAVRSRTGPAAGAVRGPGSPWRGGEGQGRDALPPAAAAVHFLVPPGGRSTSAQGAGGRPAEGGVRCRAVPCRCRRGGGGARRTRGGGGGHWGRWVRLTARGGGCRGAGRCVRQRGGSGNWEQRAGNRERAAGGCHPAAACAAAPATPRPRRCPCCPRPARPLGRTCGSPGVARPPKGRAGLRIPRRGPRTRAGRRLLSRSGVPGTCGHRSGNGGRAPALTSPPSSAGL